MVTDPVCKMQVDEKHPPATATYGGKEYYFCCEACRQKFEENPEQYVSEEERESEEE